MKKKLALVGSICLYIIAALIIVKKLIVLCKDLTWFSISDIFEPLTLACIPVFFASFLLAKCVLVKNQKAFMKATFIGIFAVYFGCLLSLTIFRFNFIRIVSCIGSNTPQDYLSFAKRYANFIPFKSIIEFLNRGTTYSMAVNIFGNLVAFMPFALFLPLLFKKCKKFSGFLITTLIINILIEIAQLFFKVGSCDIDDVILNTSGAVFIYLLFHIKPIRRFINKATMLEY